MESSIGIILIVYNYGDEGGHNGVSVDKSQTNYTRKISLTFKFLKYEQRERTSCIQ